MKKIIWVFVLLEIAFCAIPVLAQSKTDEKSAPKAGEILTVKLFNSSKLKNEVGELFITDQGSGILKSDNGKTSLRPVTLKMAVELWGNPIASRKENKFDQKTFELWGISKANDKAIKYLLDARFINSKFCAYRLQGGSIKNLLWMNPDEDKIKRHRGPRDVIPNIAPAGIN